MSKHPPSLWQLLKQNELPNITHRQSAPFWIFLTIFCTLLFLQLPLKSPTSKAVSVQPEPSISVDFYDGIQNQEWAIQNHNIQQQKLLYRVRVGTFKNALGAEDEQERLVQAGLWVNIDPFIADDGQVWYRLYSSWFCSKRDMNLFRSKAIQQGLDTLVPPPQQAQPNQCE